MKSTQFYFFILAIVVLFNSSTFAQMGSRDFEVSPSVEFTNKKNELLEKFIFSDDSGYYALFAAGKNGGGRKSIRKFNNDLSPTNFRADLKYRKKVFSPITLDVIEFNKNVYHIWYAETKEGVDFFSSEIDLTSGEITHEKVIASIGRKETIFEYTNPRLVVDSTTQMVHLSVPLVNNWKEKSTFRFFKFDSSLEQLSSNDFTFPIAANKFKIWSIRPYGRDKVALICKNFYLDNITRSLRTKQYEYIIYIIENGEIQPIKTIETNDKHLVNLHSKIEGDNLIVSGIIGNETASKPSSIYFLNYNLKELDVVAEKTSRVPDSFFEYPDKREEKLNSIQFDINYAKRNADGNYFSRELITKPNQFYLIIEQSYVVENSGGSYTPNGMMTTNLGGKTYYSNDMAIFKLNSLGELLYTSKIEKQLQWGGSDLILSFYPVAKNNKLFMFHNGNYANISGKNNFLRSNDSAFLCTVLEEDGSFQRKVISHYTEEYPNVAIPKKSAVFLDKEVLIFNRAPGNAKRQKLTKVILN